MEFTQIELNIILFCVFGWSVITAWQAGKHRGMSDTIDYFEEQGIIELDDD
jgi:hypothetical protein